MSNTPKEWEEAQREHSAAEDPYRKVGMDHKFQTEAELEAVVCAHLVVRYHAVRSRNGGMNGWWACSDCETRFTPSPMVEHIIQKERERCAMIADDGRCCTANAVCAQIPKAILNSAGRVRQELSVPRCGDRAGYGDGGEA